MPEVTLKQIVPTSTFQTTARQGRQIDIPEAPTEEVAAPQPKQEGVDRLSIIARKEQALRKQQLELKAMRDKWESERNIPNTEREELEALRALKKKLSDDTYGGLLDVGLTSDQVAAKLLNNQPNPLDQQLILANKRIEALEKQVQEASTKVDTAVTEQRNAALKQISADVKQLVDSDNRFAAIKKYGQEEAVTQYINDVFESEDILLDIEEAAKEIEDTLIEEALKGAELDAVKVKLGLTQQTTSAPTMKPTTTQKQSGMPTLSNKMTPSGVKPLSWNERRARAIAVAQGKQV